LRASLKTKYISGEKLNEYWVITAKEFFD